LLTEEPTPAFSRGSEDMMVVVAGGITFAMPMPCRKKIAISTAVGECSFTELEHQERERDDRHAERRERRGRRTS